MSSHPVLKKTIKWILGIFISLLLLVALALSLIVWILTPEQLTPIALKYANEFVNADVKMDKVELTIWKSFPNVTLDIDNIKVISHSLDTLSETEKQKLPAYSDTLVVMESFHGGINLLKLLSGEIAVNDIMFISPEINLVAYSPTVTNYDIIPPSNDTTAIPKFTINSIEITKCKGLNYYSHPDSMELNLGINAAQIKQQNEGKIQVLFDAITSFRQGNIKMINQFPFTINGVLDWDMNKPERMALNKWKINMGNAPISFSIDAGFGKEMVVNKFDMEIKDFDYTTLLQYLPKEYTAPVEKIETNIKATASIALTKPYIIGGKALPSLVASLEIPQSYLKGEHGKSIDKFMLKMNVDVDGENLDNSVVTLEKAAVYGKSIDMEIDGKAKNLVSDPHFTGEIACDADLARMIRVFEIPVSYIIKGKMDINSKFDIKMSDIKKKQYQNIDLFGKMNLRNLRVKSKKDSLDLYAHHADFSLGTKERFTDRKTGKRRNLLKTKFNLDSLKVFYKGMDLTLNDGSIGAGAVGNMAYFGDNKHIIPMGAKITAGKMIFYDTDSSRIKFTNLTCGVGARKFKENSIKTILNFIIEAEKASYRTKDMRTNLRNGKISLELTPRISGTERRIDSLRQLYPKLGLDSLTALAKKARKKRTSNIDEKAEVVDLAVDSGLKNMLKNWTLKGSIEAKRARLNTPYFPIKNTITDLDLTFSLDSFMINNGSYRAGNSIFHLNGGVKNLRTTLMGRNRKPLEIGLNIMSDTLDINQLIATAYSGMAYAADTTAVEFSNNDDDDDNGVSVSSQDSIMKAFVVPSNLDVDIDVAAKYGVYADMTLRDFSGCLRISNGVLQLNDIKTESDVGGINFNALYAAKNRDEISFVFDTELKAIQLDRFVRLIPEVDTIMPLLKSMDGVIRAEIAASTRIDSNMNVILPSLTAAMKLHGDSLVLFDSETFASIAKMLRFKNKKRNLIDDMTVELVIKDNTMELFPFMFYMDRYKVGIMGSNDLALNLNYHISVLKSPIPFKFGLNITGNADNMKYRLGKARFKEGQAMEKTSFVDNTRINLREQIDKAFKRGVHAALNSTLNVKTSQYKLENENLSHDDSLKLIKEGLIDAPKVQLTKAQIKEQKKQEKKAAKEKKKKEDAEKKEQKKKEAILKREGVN